MGLRQAQCLEPVTASRGVIVGLPVAMSKSSVPAGRPPLPALSIGRELESAARYAALALAPATRRAYDHDWRVFAEWCVARGLAPMPAAPETVAAFLAAEADRELHPVTITKRAAAIAAAHRAQGQPNPCESPVIAAVLAGIRRTRGIRPQRKAQALELEPLGRMVGLIDTGTLAGLRDCALLLLGFAAALRRSELVALDVEDLRFDSARGLLVTIRRSKMDQGGEGQLVAVPYAQDGDRCAVRSVRRYLDAAGINRGPVFRQMHRGDHLSERRLSDQSVALIVKRRAEAASVGGGAALRPFAACGVRDGRGRGRRRGAPDRECHAPPQPAGAARLHPRRDRVRRRRRRALSHALRDRDASAGHVRRARDDV